MVGEDQEIQNAELVDLFERYRPLLFSIAYSIVGIAADAQELTQETFQSWLRYPEHKPSNARVFLVTTVAALSIDYLQHTEAVQEDPAPLEADRQDSQSPPSGYAGYSSTSMATLRLLSQLTAVERIVFLLQAVFKYDYSQIAGTVGRDEAECRKIVRRVKAFMVRHRAQATCNAAEKGYFCDERLSRQLGPNCN